VAQIMASFAVLFPEYVREPTVDPFADVAATALRYTAARMAMARSGAANSLRLRRMLAPGSHHCHGGGDGETSRDLGPWYGTTRAYESMQ
jgi:hypothetical protein